MKEMATACPKCQQYYPYDCYIDGCKDETCTCDGCTSMKVMEGEE